jgi:hypothetical protein
MENVSRPKFDTISPETQEFFDKLISKISLPYDLKYLLIHADRQKQIIKLHKLNEMMSFALNYDVVISVNENLFDAIDDDTVREILFLQEIDKITVNLETGKITFIRPDVITFSSLINRYGLDAVARANQLDNLTSEQLQDKLTEEFISK